VSEPLFGGAFSLRGNTVVELRYALNDGVAKVDVQQSWTYELYNGPVQVINGRVKTNDDVAIMALVNAGFEIVPEQEPDTDSEQESDADTEQEPEEPSRPKRGRGARK